MQGYGFHAHGTVIPKHLITLGSVEMMEIAEGHLKDSPGIKSSYFHFGYSRPDSMYCYVRSWLSYVLLLQLALSNVNRAGGGTDADSENVCQPQCLPKH